MSNLLVTIIYSRPGNEPCMTTTVVPVSHMSLDAKAQAVRDTYKDRQYFTIHITKL